MSMQKLLYLLCSLCACMYIGVQVSECVSAYEHVCAYLCMGMYMYVYMCACSCVCASMRMYMCVLVCVHLYVWLCVCMYMCVHMHACACACGYVYVYRCMCVYMHVCACIHVCLCMHMCACVCILSVGSLRLTSHVFLSSSPPALSLEPGAHLFGQAGWLVTYSPLSLVPRFEHDRHSSSYLAFLHGSWSSNQALIFAWQALYRRSISSALLSSSSCSVSLLHLGLSLPWDAKGTLYGILDRFCCTNKQAHLMASENKRHPVSQLCSSWTLGAPLGSQKPIYHVLWLPWETWLEELWSFWAS